MDGFDELQSASTILDWWKGALKNKAHILLTFYPLRLGICICGGCTLIPFLPYLFCLATSFEDSPTVMVNMKLLSTVHLLQFFVPMNIEHPIHHLRQKDTQILYAKTFHFLVYLYLSKVGRTKVP